MSGPPALPLKNRFRPCIAPSQPSLPAGAAVANREIELFDYDWTDADYRRMLADAGYTSIDLYQPLGRPEDGIAWITEDRIPPFSIYVVGK